MALVNWFLRRQCSKILVQLTELTHRIFILNVTKKIEFQVICGEFYDFMYSVLCTH